MKILTKLTIASFAASVMLCTIVISPVWTPNAVAQASNAKSIVDQAKADKLVGEKLNGYLDFVVQDPTTKVRDAVNEINIKRKSIYTRLAREQNVSVSNVAGLTGEKLIAKAKPGEMIMSGDNQWRAAGS